jgi:hypothetical protein
MAHTITGDRHLDLLLPLAGRLVGAVHDNDQLGVDTAFEDATQHYRGDPLAAANALVILLAAMCDDDATPAELLQWRRNPTEYHRLRTNGVPSRTAAILAARVTDARQKGPAVA